MSHYDIYLCLEPGAYFAHEVQLGISKARYKSVYQVVDRHYFFPPSVVRMRAKLIWIPAEYRHREGNNTSAYNLGFIKVVDETEVALLIMGQQ